MSPAAPGSSRTGILGLGALISTGLCHALFAPPWGPLGGLAIHPVAWVPALAVFSRLRGLRAFLAGWLTGFAAHVALFWWLEGTLERYAGLERGASVALFALYAIAHGLPMGVFAWGVAPIRRVARAAWPAAVASWFVACEHWSPQVFPHFQGAWWAGVPEIFLATAVTGVAGMGFLLLWTNAVALQALEWLRTRDGRTALVANALGLAVAVASALGAAAWQETRVASAEATARPVRFALVQPNFASRGDTPPGGEDQREQLRHLVAMSEQALAREPGVDVVVWPEGVLRGEPGERINHPSLRLADDHDIEVWTGSMTRETGPDGAPRGHNSAFRLRARAVIDPAYHKRRLVPFSEAMPGWLPTVSESVGVDGRWGRLSPGSDPGLRDTGWGRFAFLICYEAIQGRSVREAASAGADLLVNLTHDGWFGDTTEPHQHLMLARAQAAQVGLPLVRATTTGISALVDARGALVEHGPVFEEAVVVGGLRPLRAPSLYARVGPWLAWLCTAAAAATLATAAGRRDTRASAALVDDAESR